MENTVNSDLPSEAPFVCLQKVNTVAATGSDKQFENVLKNIKRGLVKLQDLPEFKVPKVGIPVALIGGGPSVKTTIEEAKQFQVVVACGSSHDFIVEKGLIPTYCVLCDPDPLMADYIKNPQKKTTYLVSSACDDTVFEALKGHNVVIWHCHSDDYDDKKDQIDKDYYGIGGGCTVGLRSLSIFIMMGYNDIHFFGFDSCLGEENEHHAYKFATDKEELGDIYKIRLGMNDEIYNSRTFLCAGYMIAQIANFKDFYTHYASIFKPTFHGDGALPFFMEIINKEAERISKSSKLEQDQIFMVRGMQST